MKTILYIINLTQTAEESGLVLNQIVSVTDAVILIENAVYNAVLTPANRRLFNQLPETVYVLKPDLKARGLDGKPLIDKITVVDYEGFVDLSAQYDVSVSW
jgi:tRNA 2-thiouridine synthesizing protein B